VRRALRFALLGLTALAAPAFAYDVVGPNKCTNCHDHDPQKDWYYKGEGNKGHRKSLEQLEEPKGKEYAKKLGLSEDAVYSPKGRCVVCHATVVKGKDPEIGVSCETCHGAGSGYLEPHKEKNSYKQAVSLGMLDTRVKESGGQAYVNWAKMCLECHVLPAKDKDLVAAGHSSGADFKLKEKSFGQVVHWKEKYDPDALAKAATGVVPAVVVAPKAAAPEPTKPAPKAEPTKAAEPAKIPAPEPTKPGAKPEVRPEAPKAEPTKPGAKGETPKAAPPGPAPVVPTPAPTAAAPAPVEPPPVQPMPAPLPLPVVTPPPPATGLLPQLAAARGGVVTALSPLVKEGRPAPKPIPASVPSLRYAGPEGELLRLQEEVLALQLRALAPATPASPKKEK